MKGCGHLTLAIALAAASAAAARIAVVGPGGGGDIECVLASRHDPSRIFAGCDVGGFYFSSDFGRHWEIRNVGLGSPGVQTIAEHPKNPNRLAIGGHAGILLSDDLGLNWHQATNGLPAPSPEGHSLPVVKILWGETNPRRLYAATGIPHDGAERSRAAGTRGHIYRSDDGGESWKMVVAEDEPLIAERPTQIFDLIFADNCEQSLLALTSRGLFRSADAGEHWRKVGAGLPLGALARGLARAPSHPMRLYLALREKDPAPFPREASVWRSDDGGETWEKTSPLPERHRMSDGREVMDSWGRMNLAVAPDDPDDVWLTGPWFREGLCRSRDGGATWVEALREVPRGWVNDFWFCPAVSLSISATFPSNIAFGTMSGVYVSGDGGETWAQRYTVGIRGTEPANQEMGQQADDSKGEGCGTEPANQDMGQQADNSKGEGEPFSPRKAAGTGLETLCVSELLPDRFATNRLWAAFYDVGLMVTDDAGKTWERRMGGIPPSLGGICWTVAQSPSEPEHLWGVFGTWAGGGRGVPAESADGGRSWRLLNGAIGWTNGIAHNLRVLSPTAPYALAVVRDGLGLYFGEDGGRRWRAASTNFLPDARRVSALAFADGALYAGTRGGADAPPRLWRSKDRGGTWEMLGVFYGEGTTSGRQPGGAVTSIAVEKRRIAVAVRCTGPDGGCWVSDDGGATWRLAYREEPWNDLNAVALGGGRIVLASRSARWHDPGFGGLGLLSSADGGATWERHVGGGLDRPEVMFLAADPFVPNRFWFGTWGNAAGMISFQKCPQ